MDNNYLSDLIKEVKRRDGGIILNMEGKPEVVVLSIGKYNDLIRESRIKEAEHREQKQLKDNIQKNSKKILVTGGAGYIGSHVVHLLLKQGHEIVVLDNLSTGYRENIPEAAKFIEGDLKDINLLKDLFAATKFDLVMHFAASIEVEESVLNPEKYFLNNVICTYNLLSAMNEAGVKNFVFSSTAAVYHEGNSQPISEQGKLLPSNPYGATKLMAEQAVNFYSEFCGFNAVVFRYFNACGFSGDANIKPTHDTHLVANIMQVAKGQKPCLIVNGADYETEDGSCVRDYVHILDIARAHVLSLNIFENNTKQRGLFEIYNIGTGTGYSVLEMINQTAEVLNKMIPMEIGERRAGDTSITVADNSKIKEHLNFELEFSSLENIIKTSWKQISQE